MPMLRVFRLRRVQIRPEDGMRDVQVIFSQALRRSMRRIMKRVQAMTGIGLLAMSVVVMPSWSHKALALEQQTSGQSSQAQVAERHLANIRQLTVGGKKCRSLFFV